MEDKIIQKDGYTIRIVPIKGTDTQKEIDDYYKFLAELIIKDRAYATA